MAPVAPLLGAAAGAAAVAKVVCLARGAGDRGEAAANAKRVREAFAAAKPEDEDEKDVEGVVVLDAVERATGRLLRIRAVLEGAEPTAADGEDASPAVHHAHLAPRPAAVASFQGAEGRPALGALFPCVRGTASAGRRVVRVEASPPHGVALARLLLAAPGSAAGGALYAEAALRQEYVRGRTAVVSVQLLQALAALHAARREHGAVGPAALALDVGPAGVHALLAAPAGGMAPFVRAPEATRESPREEHVRMQQLMRQRAGLAANVRGGADVFAAGVTLVAAAAAELGTLASAGPTAEDCSLPGGLTLADAAAGRADEVLEASGVEAASPKLAEVLGLMIRAEPAKRPTADGALDLIGERLLDVEPHDRLLAPVAAHLRAVLGSRNATKRVDRVEEASSGMRRAIAELKTQVAAAKKAIDIERPIERPPLAPLNRRNV